MVEAVGVAGSGSRLDILIDRGNVPGVGFHHIAVLGQTGVVKDRCGRAFDLPVVKAVGGTAVLILLLIIGKGTSFHKPVGRGGRIPAA